MKIFQLERIRLARIFNIFNPKVYKKLFWILLFFVTIIVFDALDPKLGVEDFIAALLMVIIVLVCAVMRCPKYIEASNGCFAFTDTETVVFEGWKFTRNRRRTVTVKYRVSEIRDFEFSQNAVEKMFNVGHISFRGYVNFEANRYDELVKPPEKFVIYGIKNFDRFKQRLERAMM